MSSEQADTAAAGDQTPFDNFNAAGDALTSLLGNSIEEQPLEKASEDSDDEQPLNDSEDQNDDPDETEEEADDSEEEADDEDFDDLDLEDEDDGSDGEEQRFKVGDEELTVKQLQEGYMRTADYTKKTEAVAQERKAIEADRKIYNEASQQTKAIYDAMVNYVQTNLIHPMPDPSLAQTNPQQYNQELAFHYQTVEEAKKIFEAGNIANQTLGSQTQQLSQMEWQRQREAEFSKLQEHYPALRDPSKLSKFEASVNEFAKEIGFTDQDISSQAPDARVLRVLHLAKIGQKALNDRRQSKQKIGEKAIGKRTTRVTKKGYRDAKNREGMKRLAKTGSIQDAGGVLANMLLNQ